MARFPCNKRFFVLAALAAAIIGIWTLAAPQSRNLGAKKYPEKALASNLSRPYRGRVAASRRNVHNIGLITGYSSPGIFILNPDFNTTTGPWLADQIDSANITCAVITPDGLTGIVSGNRNGTEPILYFVDLSDPSTPKLLGTTTGFLQGWAWGPYLSKAGHLCISPVGNVVIVSARDYSRYHAEYYGALVSFAVSSHAKIDETDAGGGELISTSNPPLPFMAPDGQTVLVTRFGRGYYNPTSLPILRLDFAGRWAPGSAIYPFPYPLVAGFSPDGRTALVGTTIYAGLGPLVTLRLDSPGNLVVTGNLGNFLNPSSIAFAPDGKKAFILGMDGLRVLNVVSPGVVEDSGLVLPLAGQVAMEPDSLAIDPQGRYAYAGGPVVSVIDLKTNSLVGTIGMGAMTISFPVVTDVGLAKSIDDPYPVPGDTVSFTVTAVNNGPRVATGVRVSDRLPDGLSYVAHSTTRGSYDPASGLWSIGSLEQEGSAILTIRAKAERIATMTNTASLRTVNEIDPEPADDSASVIVDADVRPDFSNPLLNYEAVDRLAARAGQTVTYTISYGNSGGRAVGVVITSPADSRLENIQPLDGGVMANGQITWSLGRVAANSRGSVRFRADVGRGLLRGTKIVNQSMIVSNQTSPVATNEVFITVL